MTPPSPSFSTCVRQGLRPSWFVAAALVTVALSGLVWTSERNKGAVIEQLAVQNAEAFTFAMDEFRVYYTKTVVPRAKANGMQLTHAYADNPRALPLPATVAFELSEQLGSSLQGLKLRTVSDHPFPWRADTGGARDAFDRTAIDRLTRNPDERYYERVRGDGEPRLRFARAIVMEQACVNCHNAHPLSPKRDWRSGDVRAVMEVSLPLGQVFETKHAGMIHATAISALLGLLGMVALAHAIGRRELAARDVAVRYAGELEARHAAESALDTSNAELARVRSAAEESTEAKSQLLATISHELRTPLNAVIGMTSLLQQTKLNNEQREHADVIRHSGDNLLALISDVLDFSKIESDRLEMEITPYSVRDCVESAVELAAGAADAKGLELLVRIDPAVDGVASGDATRLRQVLVSLVNNGVKFANEGEVIVDVRPAEAEQPGDVRRIEFRVIDTGIGMRQDKIEQLFMPLGQVTGSTGRRYPGTGLGLAISRRLCELMGGTISATSSGVAGAGATFRFDIVSHAPVQADTQPSEAALRGKRVLVAYRNAQARELVCDELKRWEMQVRACPAADAALALLKAESFDALIAEDDFVAAHGDAGTPMPLPGVVVLYGTTHTTHDAPDTGADIPDPRAGAAIRRLARPIRLRRLHAVLGSAFDPTGSRIETPARSLSGGGEFDMQMGANFPLRILVAEDNMINQRVVIKLLEQMGYRADVAGNGREAISALEKQRYDVVLMDVRMPEMDGLEATRRIVRDWSGDTRPHIIALTASATQADRDECISAGMDNFITKPIRVAHLTAALRKAVVR